MAARPCQTVPPHQQVPSALDRRDHARASVSGAEGEPVPDSKSPRSERRDQPSADHQRSAPPARQVRSTRSARPDAAERAQRGPHLHAARPPRGLGRVMHRLALVTCDVDTPRSGPSLARRASGSRTNASPLSYGTLSHLWASVAQESASATPATRWARSGAAAAHSPNAPSTWTQAPAPCAAATIAGAGRTRRCSRCPPGDRRWLAR